jgi:hypothetical protein
MISRPTSLRGAGVVVGRSLISLRCIDLTAWGWWVETMGSMKMFVYVQTAIQGDVTSL